MATHETQATDNHDEIREWAESRGGRPATVKDTDGGGEAGVLRFDFEGNGDEEGLELISWDEFFDKLDQKNLCMIYQEETKGGGTSRFFKFVDRDTAKEATN